MSCAQTGSGKTAAFLLPLLYHLQSDIDSGCYPFVYNSCFFEILSFFLLSFAGKRTIDGKYIICPKALIIAPTRELCIQIFEEARKFSHKTGVICSITYGGPGNAGDQIRALVFVFFSVFDCFFFFCFFCLFVFVFLEKIWK
jgi:ATP-dependent RNA helicase DDX3X